MAITSLDGIVAGAQTPRMFAKAVTATLVAGRPASLWSLGGMPGAGAFDNTLNGVVLSSSSAVPNGAIPHIDPASNNAYLAYLEAQATQPGVLMLLDRLWHNGGFTITSTSAQNITSPTWPSRCPTSGIDQTPSTNGLGVQLAVEVSAATGAGTLTIPDTVPPVAVWWPMLYASAKPQVLRFQAGAQALTMKATPMMKRMNAGARSLVMKAGARIIRIRK